MEKLHKMAKLMTIIKQNYKKMDFPILFVATWRKATSYFIQRENNVPSKINLLSCPHIVIMS